VPLLGGFDIAFAEVEADILDVREQRQQGAGAAAHVKQPKAGPGADVFLDQRRSRPGRAERVLHQIVEIS
jgi:hypothetical protein